MKMNKYLSLFAVSALAVLSTACSKDTEDTTWVTYYPQMTLEGSQQMTWKEGVPFVDPGIVVMMNGEDVSDQVSVSSNMNMSNPQPGIYNITYGFVTPDGITAASSREVLVIGTSAPMAGYYLNVEGACYYVDGGNVPFSNTKPISVVGTGEANTYRVSDLMARSMQYWYNWDNQCPGVITINADNTLTLVSNQDNGWGVNPFIRTWQDATYDPDTKTFAWTCKPYWSASPYIHVELKLMD